MAIGAPAAAGCRSTRPGRDAGSGRRSEPPTGSSFQVCPEVNTTCSTLIVVAVVERYRLPSADLRDDVGGGGVVADDLHVRRDGREQRLVEPHQVLAHEPPRQIVGRRVSVCRRDRSGTRSRPSDSPGRPPTRGVHRIGRVLVAVGGGVQRKLPAWVVEDQVVRLLLGVDAATELAGFDHVQADGCGGAPGAVDRRSRTHRPQDPSPMIANSIIGAPRRSSRQTPGWESPCAPSDRIRISCLRRPLLDPFAASPGYAVDQWHEQRFSVALWCQLSAAFSGCDLPGRIRSTRVTGASSPRTPGEEDEA